MIDVIDAAKYIAHCYRAGFGEEISEMKLHKLLYLAQRESLVRTNEPLFSTEFQGWRFGPVIPEVRHEFQHILAESPLWLNQNDRDILDDIIGRYGGKDAWSLSRLTHGEYSWINSRRGVGEYENSARSIPIDDIRVDAERIRNRRELLSMLGEN